MSLNTALNLNKNNLPLLNKSKAANIRGGYEQFA